MTQYIDSLTLKTKNILNLKIPLNIYGTTGRTTFIKNIIKDLLIIDSREIQDTKNLSGFYAIQHGEIKYVEGILIDAMKNGKTLFIKNVDFNMNILYFLSQCIQNRKVQSNNGEIVRAHNEFRLIFSSREMLQFKKVYNVGPIEFNVSSLLFYYGNVENINCGNGYNLKYEFYNGGNIEFESKLECKDSGKSKDGNFDSTDNNKNISANKYRVDNKEIKYDNNKNNIDRTITTYITKILTFLNTSYSVKCDHSLNTDCYKLCISDMSCYDGHSFCFSDGRTLCTIHYKKIIQLIKVIYNCIDEGDFNMVNNHLRRDNVNSNSTVNNFNTNKDNSTRDIHNNSPNLNNKEISYNRNITQKKNKCVDNNNIKKKNNNNNSLNTLNNRILIYDNITNLFLSHDSQTLLSFFNLHYYPDIILYDKNITKTYAFTLGIRNLICNIKSNKYSLLVGETGTGKTSLVQYLSRHSEQYFGYKTDLKVVNMSPDYDGYDLVGGYSTIDVNKMVNELFLELKVEKPKMCDNLTCLKILKKNVINVGDYIENKSSLNGVVGNNRGDIKNMINFGDSREKKTIIGNNNVGSTLNKNNTMSDNNLGGTLNRNNTMSDNNLGGTLNKNNTMSDNNLGDTLNKNNTMSDNNLGSTLNKNNTMSDNNLGGKLNKSNIVKDNKHILDKINLLEKCIKNKTQFIWKDGLLVQAMKEGQWILLDEINLCSTETLNMIEALLSKDTLINYESGNYSNDESNKCDIGIEYNKNDTTINKKHINRKINVDMVYTNKDTINNIHPNFMLFACMNPLGVGKKNFNTVQLNKVNFQDFTTNIHDIYKIVKSYNLDLDSEKLADAFYETKKKIYKRELTNKVEPILTGRTLIRALSSISTLTKERLYNIDGFNYSLYNDCGLSNNNVTTYYNNITTICKYCSIEDIISVFILSQFDLTSRSVVYSLFEDVNINKCDDKKCLTINNMNKHNNGISNMNICNGNEDSYNNNNIYSCSNININNSSFIITNKIKILLKDIVTAINLNMPVLLQGDTSTGKTSIIYYLSNIYNKKVIRINNHEQTESSDYIGTYISLESEENGCDLKKSKKCNLESKNEYNLENENGCDLDKAEGYNLESKNEYNLDNENGCDLKKYKKCNLESKNEYNLENENDYSKYKDNKEEHMNKSKKSKLNSNKDTNNTQIHTTDHVSTANNTITSSIPSNNIIFKESIFIKAVRNGWWVILDELNLAQSDVLEVLNRLLDDNREIYIPATNTLIKAHPDFRIFATQNIEYSGRKQMSKAFRNRFIEITFYEKDENELLEILHNKTRLPKRYCNYMIQVYSKLKNMRNYNNIVTLRDLFRWSRRLEGIISEEDVYEKGLSVIYERQRNEIDRNKVMDVFDNGYVRDRCRVNEKMDNVNDKINRINIVNEKINRMDNVYEKINRINIVNEKIDIMDNVYDKINRMDNINDKLDRMDNVNDELFAMQETSNNNKINTFIYTKSMKKLIKLIQTAIKYKEPILLIGETGIGKTRICELLAEQNNTKLNYLNMHSGTESSDFIGTYSITNGKIEYKPGPLINSMINGEYFLIDEINLAESATLERLNSLLEDKREIFVTETDSNIKAHDNFILFATMNPGNDFGKSELSPALRNRFTEIYFELSEEEIYEITINRISRFFTKGYYKKDMKNENECSVIGDVKNTKMNEEMHYTNKHTKSNDKLLTNAHKIDNVIHTTDHSTIDKDLNDNYTKKNYIYKNNIYNLLINSKILYGIKSLRKIDLFIEFINNYLNNNKGIVKINEIDENELIKEGFELIGIKKVNISGEGYVNNKDYIDIEGKRKDVIDKCDVVNDNYYKIDVVNEEINRKDYLEYLNGKINNIINNNISGDVIRNEKVNIINNNPSYKSNSKCINSYHSTFSENKSTNVNHPLLKIHPYICNIKNNVSFNWTNSTTQTNLKKILRALTVNKGILLEGEPGVGKTSIVLNLSKVLNIPCVRINLSEQTELSDLVGSYVPCGNSIKFVPSDLSLALKKGHWIILDEINLCSQSVLEGLNSVLDYRKTLNLPELRIKVHHNCKIFGTMNPYNNKNGRKILPRSLVDRFISIYMEEYTRQDIEEILGSMFKEYKIYSENSLRENIKMNKILKSENVEYEIGNGYIRFGKFTKKCNVSNKNICSRVLKSNEIDGCNSINIKDNLEINDNRNMKTSNIIHLNENTNFKNNSVTSETDHIKCNSDDTYLNNYTIIHKQLPQIEQILQCVDLKIPLIITGTLGRYSLIKFISYVFNLKIFDLICHKEIDTSDILGQYHKDIDTFKWKDSLFVDFIKTGSLVVLHNPELVENCIFDRINSLFENERTLNVYEKGIDTEIRVHDDTRFIMLVDSLYGISPAILDRCYVIELSNEINYIDLCKIFLKSHDACFEIKNLCVREEIECNRNKFVEGEMDYSEKKCLEKNVCEKEYVANSNNCYNSKYINNQISQMDKNSQEYAIFSNQDLNNAMNRNEKHIELKVKSKKNIKNNKDISFCNNEKKQIVNSNNKSTYKDCSLSKKMHYDNVSFNSLIPLFINNKEVKIDDLYLEYRKYLNYKTLPVIIKNKFIYNELNENKINEIFKYELLNIKFDESKLKYIELYKSINYEVCVGSIDEERLLNILRSSNMGDEIKCITFIKNYSLDIFCNINNEDLIHRNGNKIENSSNEILNDNGDYYSKNEEIDGNMRFYNEDQIHSNRIESSSNKMFINNNEEIHNSIDESSHDHNNRVSINECLTKNDHLNTLKTLECSKKCINYSKNLNKDLELSRTKCININKYKSSQKCINNGKSLSINNIENYSTSAEECNNEEHTNKHLNNTNYAYNVYNTSTDLYNSEKYTNKNFNNSDYSKAININPLKIYSIYDLKEHFIRNIKNKHLGDIPLLKKLSFTLSQISHTFKIHFNFEYFKMLELFEDDPVLIYKQYLEYKKNVEINRINKELCEVMKFIYKYGEREYFSDNELECFREEKKQDNNEDKNLYNKKENVIDEKSFNKYENNLNKSFDKKENIIDENNKCEIFENKKFCRENVKCDNYIFKKFGKISNNIKNKRNNKITSTQYLSFKYEELKRITIEYNEKISSVQNKLTRNYSEYRRKLDKLTLDDYLSNKELREYFEQFSDLFNYYLIFLKYYKNGNDNFYNSRESEFKNLNCNTKFNNDAFYNINSLSHDIKIQSQSFNIASPQYIPYNIVVANFIINPSLIKKIKYLEYSKFTNLLCKFIYNKTNNEKSINNISFVKNLILETYFNDISFSKNKYIDITLRIPEKYLDECLRNMFNSDRVEYLFNNRILTVDDVFIDCPINWLPSEIILKLKEKYKFIGEERINDINLKDRSIENGEYINYFYETNSKDRLIESGEYKYKNNEIKLKDKLVKRTLLEDELKNEDQNNKLNITNNKNITENFLNLLLTYLNKNLSYTWLINYKYHVYILVHSLTLENTERYFLDCSLYEYCDRMKLAQEYSLKNESIYGLVLKYKAFEIEEKVEKELKNLISDSGNKKFNDKLNNNKDNLNNKLNNNKDNLNNKFNNNKDYNLFDKILVNRNNIKKFLLQPVIKYLDIEFNKPEKCTCNIKKLKCVCTNSYTREHLKDILSDIKPKTKQEILTNFYNRKSINKFTYEEICLSKVVNHISEDELHLKMLDLGMEEPSPSYLYYVYNMFINTETEHGVGIKTGTGEINVSETIKEEDEISGDNCDGKEDGDGIDYSDMEGGDIGDEEDEEEKDIECGKDEKNEDENSIEDEISDEENSVDENDNENSVDEDDIGNYEDEDDNGNSVTEDDSENCIEESDNENFVDDGVDEKNNDLNEEDLHNDTLDNTNQNNIVDYTYKEGHLNNNQTCDEAVDYERRVFGTNMEEALCPGEGDEQVEGKDEQGKYSETQHTIKISTTEIFSEKLVLILRNILENNKLNKYKGDYKNGKKLNMKKLIPYIASDYKKDKIWMKRKKNDTKDYTVRLFIDNSKSMYTPILITELTKIYSKLKNSFLALNIPVEIYKFGTDLQKIENISNLTFEDVQTNINFVNDFTDGINIVLTDGIFQNTSFYNTSFLFILIDKNDIRKMSKVSVVNNEMVVSKYLDEFGGRYSVVKWCDELEDVFENCLSEMVRNK